MGDFDADGDPDIIADGGDLKLLANLGGASFAPPVRLSYGCNGKLRVADLDSDGRPDVVKNCGNGIYALRNLGDAAFAYETVTNPQGFSRSFVVADLEGNGIPDLVVFYTDTTFGERHIRVLAGRGDCTFEVTDDRQIWDDGIDCVAGEFTGDLRADLLTPFLYPNRTAPVTPILVEDFRGFHELDGVRLQWRLAGDIELDLVGVHVQRSEGAAGPYVDLGAGRLPPDRFGEFLDVEAPRDVASWYRLVLERRDGSRILAATLAVSAGNAIVGPLQLDVRQRDADGHVEMHYGLPNQTLVSFAIHDVGGRCLWDTEQSLEQSGAHVRTWDGRSRDRRDVGRGVYMVSIRAGAVRAVRKLVLWRD